MTKRRYAILGISLLSLYCGSYLSVRNNHWIIHRSGYAFGNTDNHRVVKGDMGVMYTPGYRYLLAYWVYMPLRFAETAYWYVRYPKGQPWPYFQSSTNP
jgi:hypothetical protein